MVRLNANTAQTTVPTTTSGLASVEDRVKMGTGATANPLSAGSTGDAASVSPAAGMVARALVGSDVRSDKVAALRQAIASGTYNVSASDVADKLMQNLAGD